MRATRLSSSHPWALTKGKLSLTTFPHAERGAGVGLRLALTLTLSPAGPCGPRDRWPEGEGVLHGLNIANVAAGFNLRGVAPRLNLAMAESRPMARQPKRRQIAGWRL